MIEINIPEVDQQAERNREIGAILAEARHREHRTVTECASLLRTTRRRYSMIEQGNVPIGAVELERVMKFLNIPGAVIWKELWKDTISETIVVRVPKQCTVQLVVDPAL